MECLMCCRCMNISFTDKYLQMFFFKSERIKRLINILFQMFFNDKDFRNKVLIKNIYVYKML